MTDGVAPVRPEFFPDETPARADDAASLEKAWRAFRNDAAKAILAGQVGRLLHSDPADPNADSPEAPKTEADRAVQLAEALAGHLRRRP